jgi:hypothetical protein
VAFFEAALLFFAPQHAGCVFAFDCARSKGAPMPQANAALATAATAYRFKILCIFIFRSR